VVGEGPAVGAPPCVAPPHSPASFP
jgi:hypothetical protein